MKLRKAPRVQYKGLTITEGKLWFDDTLYHRYSSYLDEKPTSFSTLNVIDEVLDNTCTFRVPTTGQIFGLSLSIKVRKFKVPTRTTKTA